MVLLSKIRNVLVNIIDYVHKPFAKYIPTQTFRYIVCGGSNTVLGMLVFSLAFNFAFHRQDVSVFHLLTFTARISSLFVSLCITIPFGFVLSSFIVFAESQIDTRVQFIRYTGIAISLTFIATVLTEFCAFAIPFIRADIANIFVVIVTAIISYLSQRFYTFKIAKEHKEHVVSEVMAEELVGEEQ